MGFWGKKKHFERISVDVLQPGMHISVAERWLDHPFLLNEFTLENEEQIRLIIGLGMTNILWCSEASDAAPREVIADRPRGPSWPDLVSQARKERDERRVKADESKKSTALAAKAYTKASKELRNAFSMAYSSPKVALEKAMGIVNEVAGAFSSDQEISIVLLSDRMAKSNLHTHSVNVMLLSLLIAKARDASEQDLKDIGLGALFHDIGMLRVPDAVRMKEESERTSADQSYMQLHTDLGTKMTLNLPDFTAPARSVVAMHHEHYDGSGYPFKLAGEKIPLFARYAAIANRYDNLCNPARLEDAIPPAQALSRMYKIEGSHFDQSALASFIKSMGVYPPGSIVELSNGALGLVTSVNRSNTLRPLVALWQEGVKPEDAPLIDLGVETEVKIVRSLRPADLEPEVREYLNPRARTAYFYSKAVSG